MPRKKDEYTTPAMKVLGLYALLLFTGQRYSLTRLASIFKCSKQTVLRMIEQIEMSHEGKVEVIHEGGRNWYRMKTPPNRPNVTLTVEEIQHLTMCRDMMLHMLPTGLKDEISRTLSQTTVLLSDFGERSQANISFVRPHVKGVIDYSDFQIAIEILLNSMREHRICTISYKSNVKDKSETYSVAPLKIIAYRDALYVKCRYEPPKDNAEAYYEPTFAIHRIKAIKLTEQTFQPSTAEDKSSKDEMFGFMDGKPFRAKVALSPKVAMYVAERKWSKDQQIENQKDGGIILEFTTTSKNELINWILSFGEEAELLEPQDVRESIKMALGNALIKYK